MENKQKIILASESKTSDKSNAIPEDMGLSIENIKDRRMGYDRRQFSYDMFIPELRSGKCRRSGDDRRQKLRKLH